MKHYELWYKKEAPFGNEHVTLFREAPDVPDDGWEKWSLPLGNGYMGVNVFGRTETERLQITENSLSNPYFRGPTPGRAGLSNFCECYLEFPHPFSEVTDYRRSLSLTDAVAHTEYHFGDVAYQREHFASYPDRVFVTRLSADRKGALSFTLRPQIPFVRPYLETEGDGLGKSGSISVSGHVLTFSGEMAYYGIKYEGQISVLLTGGTLISHQESIEVKNADSAVLLLAVGTNYRMESRVFLESDPKKKLAPYPHPHALVTAIREKAENTPYEVLLSRHKEDYTSLFSRASIDLGGIPSPLPTDELLKEYRNGNRSRYLEELYFAYGRYLLIACSRPHTYPANLQGTWNRYASAPWSAGYWHNINVQMNYWPAFNTNLAETFAPYIEYFQAYKPAAERHATEHISTFFPDRHEEGEGADGLTIGTGGWLYKVEGIPTRGFGHSGPGTGAFTTKLFADYYEFTMDKNCLAKVAYPANRSMAKFLSKLLEEQADGSLLIGDSASPEQQKDGKPYHTKGCAFDQEMVWECFHDTLKFADILGIKDSFTEELRRDIEKLDPVKVGASGQIKEFREENFYGEIGEYHHRHISHLVGLYPGSLINGNTPDWLKAAEYTLNERGDESTGWSTAHKMNAWARVKNGNRAYDLVKIILSRCTLPNLWDTHPPFQIDGNLGATAGMAEMLLQSHEGRIHLLPALPDEWKNGSFEGLTARGGFVLSAKWKEKRLREVRVTAKVGGQLRLFVGEGFPEAENGMITRETTPGETLIFAC